MRTATTSAALTPVEQDEIPAGTPLDEFLATIAWPDVVAGCALTVERLMLPPSAEAVHPAGAGRRRAGRLGRPAPGAPGGADDGRRCCATATRDSAVRLREKDATAEVLTGAELVPGLAEALRSTFEE